MENKEEVPWTWGDGGKPSQPNIHPIDSHAVGTRFLACGYDAEMKPFGVGDWVRYTDYARIKEDLEKSDGVVFKQAVENERLKAEVERLETDVWRMKVFKGIDEATNATLKDALNTVPEWAKVLEVEAENARLKAEVEMLKKSYINPSYIIRLTEDGLQKEDGNYKTKFIIEVKREAYEHLCHTMIECWNAEKGYKSKS